VQDHFGQMDPLSPSAPSETLMNCLQVFCIVQTTSSQGALRAGFAWDFDFFNFFGLQAMILNLKRKFMISWSLFSTNPAVLMLKRKNIICTWN
jgi:hypothetical protein